MRKRRRGKVPTVREKVDNPLVFIIIIAAGVCAVMKVNQYVGGRMGWPGWSSFWGGKPTS